MITFLPRMLLIVMGWILTPFAILTAKKKYEFLPIFEYIWGNKEDGYNGDKLKWYSKYLGRSVTRWDAYVWSAWRNPAYNLRHVPWFSCDAQNITDIDFKGNTWHKGYQYSFDKKRKTVWYRFNCKSEDKKRNGYFLLIPLPFFKISIYIVLGWKIYPHLHLDPYWIERVKKEGYPIHKKRAVFVINMRLKKI